MEAEGPLLKPGTRVLIHLPGRAVDGMYGMVRNYVKVWDWYIVTVSGEAHPVLRSELEVVL